MNNLTNISYGSPKGGDGLVASNQKNMHYLLLVNLQTVTFKISSKY